MDEVAGNVVFESLEVVRHRIKDLAASFEGSLPYFFGNPGEDGASITVSGSDITVVLAQLQDEFTRSAPHAAAITSLMINRINRIISPLTSTAYERALANQEADDGTELEDGSVIDAEILWDDMLPMISGDLGQAIKVSSQITIARLNGDLRGEPGWDTVADNLTETLEDLFPMFHGAIAFSLLFFYTTIVVHGRYPRVVVSAYDSE